MAEEDAQYDPMAGESEQSTSTLTVAEPDALGSGFFDPEDLDSVQPSGKSEEGQDPAETPQADNNNKPDEGTLRWEDYTRKTQALADERRQWQQDRQQREDAFQDKQEAFLQEQRQALSPQNQQGSLAQRAMHIANTAEMSVQDRAGMTVIAEIGHQLETLQAENAELRALTPQFQQTFQQVQSLAEAQNSVMKAQYAKELDESINIFGGEATRAAGDFIMRNVQEQNPHTQKQFTISELVAMHSGKTSQEARDARGRFVAQQGAAKNGAASRGSHPSSAPNAGAISREAALAEMRATGLT